MSPLGFRLTNRVGLETDDLSSVKSVEKASSSTLLLNSMQMSLVTLPLNVSLDLGSMGGAQHDLAIIDTDPCLVMC